MKDTKLVAVLNIVWGVMGITGGLIGGAFLFLPALLARSGHLSHLGTSEVETLGTIMGIIGGVIVIGALVLSLPSIVGGIGLLKGQPWARTLVLVLSFIHLLAFPLGTALGIYGIYTLWDQPAPQAPAPPGGPIA
jgi:hypothetical protein